MKINQLFSKKVDTEVLVKLLNCFGLNDLTDKRFFCKFDIVQNNVVQKVKVLKPTLDEYYLPCKSKVYLCDGNMSEKRAVTILKQVLRLHGHYLMSKEKNLNNKKIIFYQLINENDRLQSQNMKKFDVTNVISFD